MFPWKREVPISLPKIGTFFGGIATAALRFHGRRFRQNEWLRLLRVRSQPRSDTSHPGMDDSGVLLVGRTFAWNHPKGMDIMDARQAC